MVEELQRAPSMVDVARVAGVALVTVSRVLNDSPAVRPETRQRVEDAVAQLRYRRNDLARALKRGRSTTIGVVLAGSELNELSKILLGIETASREAGYWVSISSWQGEPDRVAEAVQRHDGHLVEGVIVVGDRPVVLPTLWDLEPRVPMTAVMSGALPNPRISTVEVDQFRGACLAVRHLMQLGHRDIAHVSGPAAVFDAQARVKGWRSELAAVPGARGRLLEGDFSPRSGYALTLELWTGDRPPTAVFVSNDQMAMGVLAALNELGVSVPGDVSVVGFDDLPGSQYLVPSLTSVRQAFQSLGSRSIEVLVGMMAGTPAAHHVLEPELMVRSSSGPVRGARS